MKMEAFMRNLEDGLIKELEGFCQQMGVKGNIELYLAMLLVGSEKLSVPSAAKLLDLPANDLIGVLNKFSIHHSSI